MRVSRLAGGDHELRAGSTVGTVVVSGLRLLIRPKIGVRNLLFLLGYGAGLTRWAEERFPYAEDDDLLRAVAWIFEAEVARAAQGGLVRGYVDREETLPTLRGRVDIGAQIRMRQSRRWPLECRYQDFTDDTALNRVIKAAHRRLLRVPDLDPTLVRSLRGHLRLFAEVETVDYSPAEVPAPAYDRLNRTWEAAGRLASLILRQDSLRDRLGATKGISFTVDMNKLFERFVEAVVAEQARRSGLTFTPQASRRLTRSVRMRPDLVLRHHGRDVAVGDAKYKELELAEWPHANLYQLLAYCVALRLRRGLLIYAGERPFQREVVEGNGVVLEVVGLDLAGPHQAVLAETRRAARRLIRNGVEASAAQVAAA